MALSDEYHGMTRHLLDKVVSINRSKQLWDEMDQKRL